MKTVPILTPQRLTVALLSNTLFGCRTIRSSKWTFQTPPPTGSLKSYSQLNAEWRS